MSEDNMRMEPEYITVCEKCGSEYPVGTSYCTNPLCRANLAIYGKIVQKNASSEVDAACKKIEQMMEDVNSALSGKSYEVEKRPKYQNGFMRIMESARTAKSDSALQNSLQQAEQWKEACLNEISLLGENLESVRAQAKERISHARKTVMSALTGKRKAQEKRREYEAQYDALWTTVNNSLDSNEIKNCAMRAEDLVGQFLAEISQMPEDEAELQSAKQQAQNQIDAASEAVLKALSKKENGDRFSNKYTAEFKNISVRLQSCKTLEEVNDCAAQAEAIRDSNLREIQGMKDKTENGGTTGGTTDTGGTTGGTIGGTDDPIDPRVAAQLQREKQRTQKRINAAMNKVLKAISKKKHGDLYREKYAVGFKNISAQMQQCRTMNEVNACAVQAEELRDSDLIEIMGMKNKFGVGKSILLVLLILFVLGFIGGIISSLSNLSSNSSQGSGNSSAGASNESDANNDSEAASDGTTDDNTSEKDNAGIADGNWEENVLMSVFSGWSDTKDISELSVFGSDDWVRGDITSIVFVDTLHNEADDSWDVSEAQDGSVKAWVKESGSNNTLYIAGNGGVCAPENSEALFAGYYSLTSIEFNDAFLTDAVTNMSYMFYKCAELEKLDVSTFDTSAVRDMYAMFAYCVALSELDVSDFDTANVTNMGYMFLECSIQGNFDVSGFKTSKVEYMNGMFAGCTGLTGLVLTEWDTSNVTDMNGMFASCSSLTELKLTGFDTSNVTDMREMFLNCSTLTELDVTMFDTTNVTNMRSMFRGCSSLLAIDISSFDTSNVTDMSYMFSGCNSLQSFVHQDPFDTSSVEEYTDFMDSVELTIKGGWESFFE